MESQDNNQEPEEIKQSQAIKKMVPVLCFDCKKVLADEGGEDLCSALCIECGNKRVEKSKPSEGAEVALAADSLTKAIEENKEPMPGPHRIIVVAKTASEMEGAQKDLVVWVESRMTELKVELKDAETNLALFTKNKWRTEPSKKALNKIQKNIEYYEKMKAALEAGYVIIPNFPDQGFDVFAVRTTAKNPRQNLASGTWNRGVKDQVTNSPPLKEGKYVSPDAVEGSTSDTINKPNGTKETQITVWAEEFRDVAFPFRMAKPQILEDTAQAMKLGIFDEMIASPKFRQSKPHGDPMIMGRIIIKEGYHTKAVTFLVTWFVDTNDL